MNMTSNEQSMRRHNRPTRVAQYVESAIHTASPAQLRLMLIERAVDVCSRLSNSWREGENPGANEHSITLHDLLNELLGGVAGSKTQQENDVCERVADLYVFLSQHLVRAQIESDAGAIDEIRAVLEIEAETWRAVCAQSMTNASKAEMSADSNGSGGLNLEA
jgi:flagellar protein FliS